MLYFDPVYFVFLLPALLLAVWAQIRVKMAYTQGSNIAPRSGASGAEAAARILRSAGLSNVDIEVSRGFLSDHYDPRLKVLRLSEDVYHGRNLAAVGVAAHEAGHALQDAKAYAPLAVRNAIVPVAMFGSNASWFLLFLGAALQSFSLILTGILLFSAAVLFQVINLPVEFNASARAKELLFRHGIVASDEQPIVSKVLGAAAMTYVAATITAVLTLLYYLFRFGLLGSGSRD